jgi:F-type H+-transporting ATPase subunit beta
LERFLTQPFFATEQFSGIKGKLVSLKDSLDGCERILRDEFKDYPESALYMIGAIDEAKDKFKLSKPDAKAAEPKPDGKPDAKAAEPKPDGKPDAKAAEPKLDGKPDAKAAESKPTSEPEVAHAAAGTHES